MNPYDAPQTNPKPVKRSRKLLHYLATICLAVSMILCVGFCVLWATSYSYPQFIFYDWMLKGPPVVSRNVYWRTDNGATFLATEWAISGSDAQSTEWLDKASARGFQKFNFIRRPTNLSGIADGFLFTRYTDSRNEYGDFTTAKWLIGAPYWCLVLLTAIFPALYLIRKRMKRT